MNDNEIKDNFFKAIKSWLHEGYSADIRIIAGLGGSDDSIWKASILFTPLPPKKDNNLVIEINGFLAAQVQINQGKIKDLNSIVEQATEGTISIAGKSYSLPKSNSYSYFSDSFLRDRWFYHQHLRVNGKGIHQPQLEKLSDIDNGLRNASPPFDGLTDLTSWLGLPSPDHDHSSSSIEISISPPVDLLSNETTLANDMLKVALVAHPSLNVDEIGFAVKSIPDLGLNSRKQIASSIIWDKAEDGIRKGTASVQLVDSENALTILMLQGDMVRRQWIIDPVKARNNRALAVQHFDRDLKMIRAAVLESADSSRFELGISSLLFLPGFSPIVQLEKDSPDLIVATPAGRLVLVECTLRISDFSAKVGKLVDRRKSLMKLLSHSKHPTNVAAVLVCRKPRDQIAVHVEDVVKHDILLVTEDALESAFHRVRLVNDPDQYLLDAEAELHELRSKQNELDLN